MLETLKLFYKKFKPLIIMATITLLLFLCGFCEPFWIAACVVVFFFYLTCSFGEILCYSLYFAMFSALGTFYVYSLLIAFVIISGKYIYQLCKKKQKFYAKPFIFTTLFVLLFSLIHYEVDYFGFEQGLLVVALLYVMYFAFVYRKQIDVKKCFDFLFIGMIASSVLGVASMVFDNFAYSIFYVDSASFKRLQLFCYHQNYLANFSIFALAFNVYQIVNGKIDLKKQIPYIALTVVLGLLTMSKAFMLMCVLIFAYLFVYLIAKFKLKSLIVILPAIVVVAVLMIIFRDFVKDLFSRFFIYTGSTSILNKITTGRIEIWEKYISEFLRSVPRMLFGVGLFNVKLISIGPHSVFIYFLYRTGFVGVISLALLGYCYFKESEVKIKPTLKNMLLFLTYVILSFNEMVFSDRFFIFLILSLVLMTPKQRTCETEENGRVSDEQS